MSPGAALYFAAGLGTRMAPLTAERPKPLIEVAGRPLIDHALAFGPGLQRRVVNLHYKGEMIREHLAGRDVLFSDERDRLLETGGGLRAALPLLGSGPVYTLNTDAVWAGPDPVELLAGAWDPARMEALLLLIAPGRAVGHAGQGDFAVGEAGRLTRGRGAIYSGVQIVEPSGLSEIGEEVFSLNLLWDRMIGRSTLFGLVYPGHWCDVGRPEAIPLAEALLESGHV